MRIILVCILSIFIHLPALSAIIYVRQDATGANDGSSWVNAYTDLQSAISSAVEGDEIWVSSHVYKPTSTSDRTVSFNLVNGVKMYGGFIGTETSVSERNLVHNISTLSGNIGFDSLRTDNSYHIVKANDLSAQTFLNGFRISNGFANGISTDMVGAGIYDRNSHCVISNCVLDSNYALVSGGAYYKLGSGIAVMDSCVFKNNNVGHFGAAVFVSSGDVSLGVCQFFGNYASGGAGIYMEEGILYVNECLFEGGVASQGTSIYYENVEATINKSVFKGNHAINNGAGIMSYYGNKQGNYNDCIFIGNTAGSGSAIYVSGSNEYQNINRCIFSDNESQYGSTIHTQSTGRISVENCLMVGNSSSSGRGAITADAGGPGTIVKNCTVAHNKSAHNVPCVRLSGSALVANNIFQGNSPGGGNVVWLAVGEAYNNLSDEAIGSSFQANNQIGLASFVNPSSFTNAPFELGNWDYRLRVSSKGINTGNNSLVATSADLDGNQRIYADSVDLGAYENQYCSSVSEVNIFCGAGNITLSVIGGNAYSWSNGNVGASITVNQTGNYHVTVYDDTTNCIGNLTIPVTADVFTEPVISLESSSLVLSTGIYDTYQWRLNGGNISGATAQSYTPAISGNYSVLVTNSLGCEKVSSDYNYLTNAGIQEIASDENIVIYPNPASNQISLHLKQPSYGCSIEILDNRGCILKRFHAEKDITNVDVSFLSQGIYMLRGIFEDENIVVKRIVIVR